MEKEESKQKVGGKTEAMVNCKLRIIKITNP
jgi:hypothetical protein